MSLSSIVVFGVDLPSEVMRGGVPHTSASGDLFDEEGGAPGMGGLSRGRDSVDKDALNFLRADGMKLGVAVLLRTGGRLGVKGAGRVCFRSVEDDKDEGRTMFWYRGNEPKTRD